MAVRIPMSPDPDGIIRLKCEDQELEIEVKPQSGATSDPDRRWINPTVNPIDQPVVLMRTDFDPHALLKSILTGKMRKAAADQGIVYVAQESLDFHHLFELGKGLEGADFGSGFSVAFESFGKRGGLG